MIKVVELTRFKQFKNERIQLAPRGLTFLAGANNSGKSSLLQAIAVWEFARTVLEMERGKKCLLAGYSGQGLGVADDEFSPVALPSLKHLWTNLKTQGGIGQHGYSLSIVCRWDDNHGQEKVLGLSLALANDRLFIKASESNLIESDKIPRVAYLPSFAGITTQEQIMSPADRRGLIGRGLAGGIIRNLLLDMYRANEETRKSLKAGRRKIKGSDLARLRQEDPWERLRSTLVDVFQTELSVSPFNEAYHRFIRVQTIKGSSATGRFVPFAGANPRDMMAEGTGFLQWLSVYSLALDGSVDVMLLDEPDAHLHPSLQSQLIERLDELMSGERKQALLATHSTEILRWSDHQKILSFAKGKAKYLTKDDDKIPLFLGLGSDYAPKIDPLRRHKRMLIVENLSDFRLLSIFAERCGVVIPKNLVPWPWTGGARERKQLFQQLKIEVQDLKALSLRDRDDTELEQVDKQSLRDKSTKSPDGLNLRVWRRRHIENYVLFPPAIARAAGVPLDSVVDHFASQALVVPADFASREVATPMIDARGKELTRSGPSSIYAVFNVLPEDIAAQMEPQEVPEDVKEFLRQIVQLCN